LSRENRFDDADEAFSVIREPLNEKRSGET
jgi:hypothetical protein